MSLAEIVAWRYDNRMTLGGIRREGCVRYRLLYPIEAVGAVLSNQVSAGAGDEFLKNVCPRAKAAYQDIVRE